MSTKHFPGGFKFDFGSTVTILTSVATGNDNGKHINSLGIFTGVVLDETELKLKRDPKHISISIGGIEELHKDEKYGDKHEDKYEDKYTDKYEDKYDKHSDKYGDKHCEKCGEEYKGENSKCEDEWKKPEHGKCHHEDKKHGVEVNKTEEFLILSLTCPSYPFAAGQIVWVNIEQVVAFTVACRN